MLVGTYTYLYLFRHLWKTKHKIQQIHQPATSNNNNYNDCHDDDNNDDDEIQI